MMHGLTNLKFMNVFSFLHLHKGSLDRLFDLILLIKHKLLTNGDFNERRQYYQHGEVNSTQFSGSEYTVVATIVQCCPPTLIKVL